MSFLVGTTPRTGSPVIIPGQGPKLLLRRDRLRMQVDPSGISSLTRPAQALDGPIMPGTSDIVRTPQEVTRGLGLDASTQAELEVALRRAADSGNILAFRKLVMESTRTLAPTNMPLRAELSRRALLFYKHSAKPVPNRHYERLVVQKSGGPFIGPRGGKWKDAQHTESWVDPRQIQLPHHEVPRVPFKISGRASQPPLPVDPRWKREHTMAEAGGEMSRAQMRKDGWRAVGKSGDLHRHGYQVVIWVNPAKIKAAGNVPQASTGGELANKLVERGQAHGTVMYEYLPRPQEFEPGTDTSHMKRMTATNGDEQREVHRFVGAGMPNAGEQLPMFKSVTDADLEAIRPRLVLRVPAPGPWELLWLTEEVPDDLNKGAGHKYLKRLPTGKTKRRWRYIYALPDGSTVNSTELVPGSKFAITHLGKTGHFEVVGNNANGTVSVKHDETGRTIHLTQHDLGAWFTSHHARRTAEVTARAAHAKAAPALERGTIADLGNGGLDQVDGFSNDARELEVQASSMDASRQYLVIPQAGGFVLASRPRHAPTPGQALGEATQVFVRNDQGNGIRGLDAEYVVMESDKVIPSHDAMTFDKNPKYPEGVQERRYESIPSEQLKIERIANNLEPRLVANTNPDAINGTPVVNSDGVVLGGNGRTMGIQRAYIQYPERAAAMKQFLIHHAKAFGATPAHVAALKQPILVRRVHAGEDRAALTKLGRRMNEPLMQGLDPRSEEVAVSRFVTQEVVDSLTHHMEADQALGDFLSRPNSLPFVKDVEHAGIIDQYNRAKYLDEKTGLLNDDGKTRVTRVLAARMIPDADLLDAMPVSWRESLARATPYLLQAEHAGWDMRPALTAAAKLDREMQSRGFGRSGKDRRAFFGQMGLFGTTEHTPIVRTMLGVLQDHGDKVRSFPQGWKQVSLEASRQSHDYGQQGALFKREPVTMEQAVDQAFAPKKPDRAELLAAEREGEEAARRVMAYTRGEPGAQLALSMQKSLRKAGQRDALHTYLSQAVVWELNNQMRGALWAAGGEGHIDGAKIVTRLQEFIRDQAKRDTVFARALGANPLTPAVLRALVQAQCKANLASIVKALASHQMDLVKAHGPFIGPKGGKWADAAHTVSWHAPEAIQPLLQHEGPDLFAISMARPSKEHNFEYASTSKPNVPGTVHREVEGQWITYSKQPIKLDTVMEHGLAPLGQAAGHTVLEHAQRLRVPVELKARWGTADNPRAAALWPNPRVGWQMSHFDSHGASGHVESTDPVKLVNEAIREGYDQFEPGVVDKIVDPVKVAEMAARMAESDRQTREAREAYERAKQVAAQVGQHPAVVAMNQEAERPKLTVKDIKVGKPVTPKLVEYRQPEATTSRASEPLMSAAVQEWFKKPLAERMAILQADRGKLTGLPWDKSVQKSGGPFIGPKGGKWADAAHTESWRPEQATPPAAKPLTGKHKALLVAMAQRPNATLANGRVVPGSNTGAAIDKVSSTLGPRGHWHAIVRGLEARGLIHVYEKNSVASGSRFGRQQHDGYSVLTNEGKAALAKQGVDTGHVLTYEDNEAGNRAEQGEVAKAEVPLTGLPWDKSVRKAGGPFIGPKGGKWADAAHTQSWQEGHDNQGRNLAAVKQHFDTLARLAREGSERATKEHAEIVAKYPLPDWTEVEGVKVLRAGTSPFVAVPGKKKGTFDIVDLDKREAGPTLKEDEVRSWLWRASQAAEPSQSAAGEVKPKPAAAVRAIEETVYSDGSGSAGTYEVYGVRMSGINNGEGKVTVTPLGLSSGHRTWASKRVVKQAVARVEEHVRKLGEAKPHQAVDREGAAASGRKPLPADVPVEERERAFQGFTEGIALMNAARDDATHSGQRTEENPKHIAGAAKIYEAEKTLGIRPTTARGLREALGFGAGWYVPERGPKKGQMARTAMPGGLMPSGKPFTQGNNHKVVFRFAGDGWQAREYRWQGMGNSRGWHAVGKEQPAAEVIAKIDKVEKAEAPVGTIHQWAIGPAKKVAPHQWEPVAEGGPPGQAIAAGPAQQPAQARLVVRRTRRPQVQAGASGAQAQGGTKPPAGETKAPAGEQKPGAGEQNQAAGEPTKHVVGRMKMATPKVGVDAFEVPPPPPIRRLPNLPPEQAEAQEEFATTFEANPDGMAADYLANVENDPNPDNRTTFSTDDAKMLSARYNKPGDLTARGTFNLATHQVGNAIAKKAFLLALDKLTQLPEGDPRRTLLVTSGGVASGKGYALKNVAETKSFKKDAGAVWDAAGEQNATENPWVLEEAEKRGLKAIFVFVDADPDKTWENPERGVMQRATIEGRMVDADPYADSYAEGARNFKRFYEAEKNNPNARFVFLENRGTPRLLDSFPEQALVNRKAVYDRASKAIDSRAADLPSYVYEAGTMGRKVWPVGKKKK